MHFFKSTVLIFSVFSISLPVYSMEMAHEIVPTTLHRAIDAGQPLNLVQFIVELGTDLEAQWHGKTPLASAVEHRRHDLVLLLLQHGADVESRNKDGRTPLHVAVMQADRQSVALLLAYGAAIDAPDTAGVSPVRYAIDAGNTLLLKYMVYHATFDPQKKVDSSQYKRIQAALLVLSDTPLPRELICKVVAHVPEDILNEDHLKFVLGYADMHELVCVCPFAWFKYLYDSAPEHIKNQFLDRVLPAFVEYRLANIKKLFIQLQQVYQNVPLDPIICAFINVDTVAQHRADIELRVFEAFVVPV